VRLLLMWGGRKEKGEERGGGGFRGKMQKCITTCILNLRVTLGVVVLACNMWITTSHRRGQDRPPLFLLLLRKPFGLWLRGISPTTVFDVSMIFL
jgi:hypothetical protein